MNVVLVIDFIPPSKHHMNSNIKEAKPGKADHVVFCVLLDVIEELFRHISPVASRLDMVSYVIAVVE